MFSNVYSVRVFASLVMVSLPVALAIFLKESQPKLIV